MERRAFIKSSCSLCAMAASGLLLANLAGCSPAAYTVYKTEAHDNMVRIPLSLFSANALQVIRTKESYYDIAVQKKGEDDFTALLLQCTHQDNALTPVGGGYHCNLHGSEFDMLGNVKKAPAEMPLRHFKTTKENNYLIIHI